MKCTFNVIVIGKPSVGKSSLCRMYLKAQTLRSSPSSRLQIFYVPEYDTFLFGCDGQDGPDDVTDQQLHAASLVILVQDLTKPCDVNTWIRSLRSRREELDIVIFGNKADRPRRVLGHELEGAGVKVYLTSIHHVDSVSSAFDNVLCKLSSDRHENYNYIIESCTGCHIV